MSYRELRRLESVAKQRISELAASTGLPAPKGDLPYVRLANFYGIELQPAAVLIARVTLWMGHRQMIDKYGESETPLPLVNLAGITIGDAVFEPWPEVDCIVGNPPFIGDRRIRRELGGAYLEKLKKAFPGIGVVDYCAYWFRLAHERMKDGQRAGLVSTNTLRENKHRLASLRYILENGGVITDAVSSQKWPGEANVHVSLTNWVKNPPEPVTSFTLDGVPVDAINSRLEPEQATAEPFKLKANGGKAFIGCQPTGEGFLLDQKTAQSFITAGEGDVVRRYLTSDDLIEVVGSEPSRWIIDFGTMPLESAAKYPKSLKVVRDKVRPEREGKGRHFERLWWQFAWPRPPMREALKDLDRYIVSTLTGKRLFVSWAQKDWCPSNLVGVFAFDDDYAMGILSSYLFEAWARGESSTFETRIRFTPSTAYETFPWPAPTATEKAAVEEASRALLARRREIALSEQLGLTDLYNLIDDGAYQDLAKLHRALDEAVVATYHWPLSIAQNREDLRSRIWQLNQRIGEGKGIYAPT
nr:DNA methyltransferase [Mycobacterium sp. 852002-10029_SCH5224772]